jgi:16S rRNA (guanine527-N7)-methyltransferase
MAQSHKSGRDGRGQFDEQRLADELSSGLEQLGLPLDSDARLRLIAYLKQLHHWNRAYNLTAVREPQAMVARHLLESLAIVPCLNGGRLADVGAGPGLPGIPLAIARPDWLLHEIDSNGKKCRFMEVAVSQLALSNVSVHQVRLDGRWQGQRFDGIVTRAFATIAQTIGWAAPLLAPGGRLYAMKGVAPERELAEMAVAAPGWQLVRTTGLTVPGVEGERCLVELAGPAGSGECDG